MIEKLLFSNTMSLMERGLDASALRNEVIANNLANVDTPGFKRSDVVFEEELRRAVAGQQKLQGRMTHPKHIPIPPGNHGVIPRIITERETSIRNDGNNVDIDREMALMAKNSIMYDALTQALNGDLRKIKMAIEGR